MTGGAILIAGPTASGKSALAMEIAALTGGEIINADSMQVYACWRVLTARPGATEEARFAHRLYGHVDCSVRYSVGGWLRDLKAVLPGCRRPIIVGGTGLNFSALTRGLAEIPEIPAEIRRDIEARLVQSGSAALRTALLSRDPAAATLDLDNPRRLTRALEVFEATGRSITDWARDTPPPLLGAEDIAARLVLSPEREALNARIERRFDAMLREGALDEARGVLRRLHDPEAPAMKALGAPSLFAHLRGEIPLSDAADHAKVATRQYAKRQRTWFRNQLGDWPTFHAAEDAMEMLRANLP